MRSVLRRSFVPVAALLFVGVVVHYGSGRYFGAISGLASVGYNVICGLASIAAVLAGSRLAEAGDARGARAWRWLAVCTTSALVAQAVNVLRYGEPPTVWADVAPMFGYAAAMAALWALAPRRASRAERAVATVDLAMLGVATATLWFATEMAQSVTTISMPAISAYYILLTPTLALMLVISAGLYFMRLPVARRPGEALMVAASAIIGGGDLLLAFAPRIWDLYSNIPWAGAALLIVVAADRAAPAPAVQAPSVQEPNIVPYLAVGAVFLALLVAQYQSGQLGVLLIASGGALLVLLLVVRQWQALRANAALVRQLREAERLDALGRMARGVAHDFNGMLTSILGNAEFASEDAVSDPAAARESIEHIRRAALTARDLTSQLLAFARAGAVEQVAVDIVAVARAQWPLLASTLPTSVQATFNSVDDALVVQTGNGFVAQLLHNLVTNARDAMPEGGTLAVSLSREDRDAVLRVSDTGRGMDAATRDRIFEPFFTTKGVGGSGLGLATVYGIVRQSGGQVHVESAPGKGSTFEIRLPLRAPL